MKRDCQNQKAKIYKIVIREKIDRTKTWALKKIKKVETRTERRMIRWALDISFGEHLRIEVSRVGVECITEMLSKFKWR